MRDYTEIEALTTAYAQMIYDRAYNSGYNDRDIEKIKDRDEQNKNICLSCKWISNYEKCVSCCRLIRTDNYEAK